MRPDLTAHDEKSSIFNRNRLILPHTLRPRGASTEFAVAAVVVLAKLCAAWLVVLVMVPFTAPFSTFDLRDLAPTPTNGIAGAPSSTRPTTAIAKATWSHAVPFPPRVSRLRLRVVTARLRLSSLVVNPHHGDRLPPAASTLHAEHPSGRPTVLRI